MKPEPRLTVPFTASARRGRRFLLALGLWSLASATLGHTGVTKPPPGAPATKLSGVTVVASRVVPHVQSTFPAADAKVPPGLLVLRVTYDTRMRAEGWSYARATGAEYPDCAASPRLLDDGKTFVLICRTLPAKSYSVWFNRPPLQDFASLSRRAAIPFQLKFATTAGDPIRTLPEAMKADPALSNVANPVEPDGLAVYGQHAPG